MNFLYLYPQINGVFLMHRFLLLSEAFRGGSTNFNAILNFYFFVNLYSLNLSRKPENARKQKPANSLFFQLFLNAEVLLIFESESC